MNNKLHLYISMLRGINVSGKNIIKMDFLKSLYESLGFSGVQTYIQSGNVLFNITNSNPVHISKQIHDAIQLKLGLEVPVLIRTIADFKQIIHTNPFTDKDPSKVVITFLEKTPDPKIMETIEKAKSPDEEFLLNKYEFFLYCPLGYGRTKLSNTFFERKFGLNATTRNWKTVTKLMNLAQGYNQ